MVTTQFFFTLCLVGVLVSTILVLIFFLCAGPDQKRFVLLIKCIGYIMLGAGLYYLKYLDVLIKHNVIVQYIKKYIIEYYIYYRCMWQYCGYCICMYRKY